MKLSEVCCREAEEKLEPPEERGFGAKEALELEEREWLNVEEGFKTAEER